MPQYVIGRKGVIDNIKQNNVSVVYVRFDLPELQELKKEFNFKIIYRKDNAFYNEFEGNHQFIIAELKTNNFYDDYKKFINSITNNANQKKLIVMLDEIQDPGNFGSIIRTCDCFGIDGIIYKKNNQVQINDIVIKTSAGAISNVNMLVVTNLSNTIEKLKNDGYWIVASTLDKDSVQLNKTKVNFDKTCLILGNENNGISKILIDNSDLKIMIPMSGISQSLNVGVSLGIFLYTLKYI